MSIKERMKPQDVADLKQLIEFLKEYQVAEFDLDRGDLKIRLKFNQPQARTGRTERPGAADCFGSAGRGRRRRGVAAAAAAPLQPRPLTRMPDLHMVKSPIVGTYYGSPSPGAAPFVAPEIRLRRARSSASWKR